MATKKNAMVEAETVRVRKYTVEFFREEVEMAKQSAEGMLATVTEKFLNDVKSDGIAYAMKWAEGKLREETAAKWILHVCEILQAKAENGAGATTEESVKHLELAEGRLTEELLNGFNSWAHEGEVGVGKANGIRSALETVRGLLRRTRKVVEAQEAGKPDEKAI